MKSVKFGGTESATKAACKYLQNAKSERNRKRPRSENRSETLRHKYLQTRFDNKKASLEQRNLAARVLPTRRLCQEQKTAKLCGNQKRCFQTFNDDNAARHSPTLNSPAAKSGATRLAVRNQIECRFLRSGAVICYGRCVGEFAPQ